MIIIKTRDNTWIHVKPELLTSDEHRTYKKLVEKFENRSVRSITVTLDPDLYTTKMKTINCEDIISIELH